MSRFFVYFDLLYFVLYLFLDSDFKSVTNGCRQVSLVSGGA
jgi:hypothetical protein